MQVGAKLSFPHFGIDFRHLHIVLLSFTFEARRETGYDTFHIVLVDLGFHLQFGRDHLADTFALGDHLLMPLRQQRGFAKSSAGADDAQPALLNGTEKLKQPGALQQLYRGARRDEFGQD